MALFYKTDNKLALHQSSNDVASIQLAQKIYEHGTGMTAVAGQLLTAAYTITQLGILIGVLAIYIMGTEKKINNLQGCADR